MRNWKTWLKCAAVRSIKTVCQTAIATIGTATVLGDVNWKIVVSASVLSGILSMLTSLAGIPEEKDDVILTPEESYELSNGMGYEEENYGEDKE